MSSEHPLLTRVAKAKEDARQADDLIRDYMPFITEQTMRHLRRPVIRESDDELSIAMFGFYEAIRSYSPLRGPFLAYASLLIRSRLIDYARSEKKHRAVLSANAPIGDEDGQEQIEFFTKEEDSVDAHMRMQMTKEEVDEFADALAKVELTLSDITDACPRQQRTLTACHIALNWAKQRPGLAEQAAKTGKVPLSEICEATGIERKTLERHRKYLLALLIAYTNGFEIIRGHLRNIVIGGEEA